MEGAVPFVIPAGVAYDATTMRIDEVFAQVPALVLIT
jgi:hypothetical protein